MGASTQAPPQAETSTPRSRAVAARVQPKLRVSRTGDAREQEADRVADVVTSRAASVAISGGETAAGPVAPSISRMAQRAPQFMVDRQEDEEAEASVDRQEDEEAEAAVDRQDEDQKKQAYDHLKSEEQRGGT